MEKIAKLLKRGRGDRRQKMGSVIQIYHSRANLFGPNYSEAIQKNRNPIKELENDVYTT